MRPEKGLLGSALGADFLGTGWAFPPAFGAGGGEVETVSGAEDIQQSLGILLSTLPGERILQETFGCDLGSVLFEEIDQGLLNTIGRLVEDAILYHEPRIRLDGVEVGEDSGEAGLLRISVSYTVRGTNSRFNLVYPFYLNESATPA